MDYCLKCSGEAIDQDGFCYSHSSDTEAKSSYIDSIGNRTMTKEQLEALIADDDLGLLKDDTTPEEWAMAQEFVRFFKSQGLI